ncbi:hypothetical protein D3C72_2516300 [compost metagenome]
MRRGARNEKQWARGDGLDVVEWVEVHELHIAGQRRHGSGLRRCASGGDLAARSAVEIIELVTHSVAGQL